MTTATAGLTRFPQERRDTDIAVASARVGIMRMASTILESSVEEQLLRSCHHAWLGRS